MQLTLPTNGPLNQRAPVGLGPTTKDPSSHRIRGGPAGNTIADGVVSRSDQFVRRKFCVAIRAPTRAITPEMASDAIRVEAGLASQMVVASPREAKIA